MYEIIKEIENMKNFDSNMGVYCIVSVFSPIIYIGQSTDLKSRFDAHRTEKKMKWKNINEWRAKNEEYLKSMNLIGEENVKYIVLMHCPEDLLITVEKYYIKIFQTLGYEVFGSGSRNGIIKVKPYIRNITKRYEELQAERLPFANLDRRYQIIIDEYKLSKDKKIHSGYTEFLIGEMIEGIQYYNNFDIPCKEYIEEYMKVKVDFVSSTLNYIAYKIFYEINKDEEYYVKNNVYYKVWKENGNHRGEFTSLILCRVKNDSDLNNELITWIIYYSNKYIALMNMERVEVVVKVAKRLNIQINNMFDFLYYYIITISIEKEVWDNI